MTATAHSADRSHVRLVVLVCAAQVLVQLGAFFWPALLPGMMSLWKLTNSQAGWITAIFYAAYMVSVPVLVTLTDRIDARHVYLFGVGCTVLGHGLFALVADGFWPALAARALTGMGWAGTYMTGLKLLADKVDAKLLSRATTGHAASIGISGAISFACADLLTHLGGWQLAFLTASTTALLAWFLVFVFVPRREVPPALKTDGSGLFDFRPVFRNRSSMAYGVAYCVHTLEMNALRGWGVAFLVFVAGHTGATAKLWSPTVIMTILGLLGTLASVLGNEAAIRFGRRRLIAFAMTGAIVMAGVLGVAGSWSYGLAVALLAVYTTLIWLDSSSLTAGAAGTAEPSKRGATLAVHSMLGYAGGFVGPLAVGWMLDGAGGASPLSWGLAFALIAVVMSMALAAFWWLQPRELAGDRGNS
jgi:predicted MFS family arabinose efflux permease